MLLPEFLKKFTLDCGYIKKNFGFRSLQLRFRVVERTNCAEKHTDSKIPVFVSTAPK